MRDNLFLIMFCVFFIVLDTLILGYSIGRIYPPIPQQVSAQQTVSSARKEKQKQESEEQEEIGEDIQESQEQEENKTQEEDLLQKQNLSVSEQPQEQNIAEQQQNLQNEQQTVTITQDENTINTITEPEVPYTYTRDEINAMLVIDDAWLFLESDTFDGQLDTDTVTDTDEMINGEICYMGMAYTGVAWNELTPYDDRAGFFVGNQSLKVYNERKEYIGMATENFLPALAKENQSHLEQSF